MERLSRRTTWTARRSAAPMPVTWAGRQECVLLGGPYDGRKVVLADDCKELKVYPLEDYHDGPDVYLRFGTMLICQLKVNKQAEK